MCSPNRKTWVTQDVANGLFTQPNNLKISSCIFFLATVCIFATLLRQTTIPSAQMTSANCKSHEINSTPITPEIAVSSQSWKSFIHHSSMPEHLHTASPFIIALSMDIHPNPGPTAIPILQDFTTSEQRKHFNTAKRLQLKITRYEQHKSNYLYYYKLKLIPKGLAIKCQPTIKSIYNNQFNQQWTELLFRTSQEMLKLLKVECEKQLRLLTSDLNYTLNQLQSSCSACTMNKIKHFLSNSAAELLLYFKLGNTKNCPPMVCFSCLCPYTSVHFYRIPQSVTSHTQCDCSYPRSRHCCQP